MSEVQSGHGTNRGVEEARIEAVVTRCGCGDPLNVHGKDACGNLLPCPTPKSVEDRGVVSYWHRSLWRRAWFWLTGRVWQ